MHIKCDILLKNVSAKNILKLVLYIWEKKIKNVAFKIKYMHILSRKWFLIPS